jgi:hypothetical protein
MTFPRVRRSIAIATVAGGTLLGSAFGVSHALAAAKASPTPSQSGSQSGTKAKTPGFANQPFGHAQLSAGRQQLVGEGKRRDRVLTNTD